MHYLVSVLDKTSASYKLLRNFDPIIDFGDTYSFGKVGILTNRRFVSHMKDIFILLCDLKYKVMFCIYYRLL